MAEGAAAMTSLLSTIRLLYPGSSVQLRRAGAGRSAREFLVLLSRRRPRLLIPADSRAAAVAIGRASARDGAVEAIGRRAMAAAVRAPSRRLLFRDVVSVDPVGPDPVEEHLAAALRVPTTQLRFAVAAGSPRANNKPVLDLLTADGQRLGFAKVATTALSTRLVHAEARTLQDLAKVEIHQLAMPVVLHIGRWRDHEILVLSALPNGRGSRSDGIPVDAMREIATIAGTRVTAAGGSNWFSDLRRRAEQIATSNGRRLLDIVDRFDAVHGAIPMTFGAWHGDWGPWNMGWADNRPQVWDWERFNSNVPIGLDAVHFVAHRALRRVGDHVAADRALAGPAASAVRQLGVRPPVVHATVDAYLLEISCRFVADSRDMAGTEVRALAEWHLAVAERRLGIPASREVNVP